MKDKKIAKTKHQIHKNDKKIQIWNPKAKKFEIWTSYACSHLLAFFWKSCVTIFGHPTHSYNICMQVWPT